MSWATVSNTIRVRFYNEWKTLRGFTDAEMTSRVAWQNKNFTKPNNLSWVRFTNIPAVAEQKESGEVGSRTFRTGGRIVIQVFVPDNAGDAESNSLCEDVIGIFEGVSAGGVRYAGPNGESPRVQNIGNDGSGWFQQNCEIPWSADWRS